VRLFVTDFSALEMKDEIAGREFRTASAANCDNASKQRVGTTAAPLFGDASKLFNAGSFKIKRAAGSPAVFAADHQHAD